MRAGRARFSTHVAWTLATRILMLGGSVGASIIVARWMGADGVGALAVLNVTVAVAVQLGSAGLPSANTYFISRDKSRLSNIWANALMFAIAGGALLALLVTGLARLRPDLFGHVQVGLIALAMISVPFQLISLLGLNLFLGLNRIASFNILEAASQSLLLLNAIFALIIFGAGLGTLVSLNVAATALTSIAIIYLLGREVREMSGGQRFRPDAGLFKEMARYGLKFHIALVAGMLIFRADLLIVNHFRGAREAGVYAVASQVATMLMVLPGIIGTLIFPRITSTHASERGEQAMRATRHTAFIMLIIFALVTPFVFLLPLFYGQEFAESTWQLLILLPGVYLLGVEAVLVQYFNSTGIPKAIPLFWLITLATNVVLNLLFVPIYGARAAAASSSISYALIFLLVAVYFRLKTGHSFSEIMLLRAAELRRMFAFRGSV